MDTIQAAAALGIPLKRVRPIEVNPLTVAAHYCFDGKTSKSIYRTYRDDAIDLVLRKRVSFQSDSNCLYELAKRFIKIVCPSCSKDMTIYQGGGDGHNTTLQYRCESCKIESGISLRSEGFFVNFPPVDLSNVDMATLLQLPCTASALDEEWLKVMLSAEVVEIDSANDIAKLSYQGNRVVADYKRTKTQTPE